LIILGVGGPYLVSGEGWDPAPLLLAAMLLMLLGGAGARLRLSRVIVAIAGGIAIDLLTDALVVSPIVAVAPIVVALAFVASEAPPSPDRGSGRFDR
jgi:hypothetical protein